MDLSYWIPVLDICDTILEECLSNLNKPLLIGVLRLTEVLLSNSFNDHIYNSYDVNYLISLF